MKTLTALFLALALFAAACTTGGSVFEPRPGLECSTNFAWTEQAVIRQDATGVPTRGEAIEEGSARWKTQPGLEVTLVQDAEGDGDGDGPYTGAADGASRVIGALVVEGRRVVLLFPAEAPQGGWLITTVQTCEGYER